MCREKMNLKGYNLSTIIPKLLEFRHNREWEKFHRPKELATATGVESAELQELFLWKGEEKHHEVQSDSIRMKAIEDEIADICIYLIYLSNDLGINLLEAVQRKLEKNKLKYPTEKYKGIYSKPI